MGSYDYIITIRTLTINIGKINFFIYKFLKIIAVVEKNNRGYGYQKTCGCIAVAVIRSITSTHYTPHRFFSSTHCDVYRFITKADTFPIPCRYFSLFFLFSETSTFIATRIIVVIELFV